MIYAPRIVALLALLAFAGAGCTSDHIAVPPLPPDIIPSIPPIPGTSDVPQAPEYKVEEVVSGLEVPWSIAFTSADRFLVTERDGRVRVVENGKLKPEALHTFTDLATKEEEGLMSLVTDPQYAQNKHIYLCAAKETRTGSKVQVLRFTDEGTKLSDEQVVVDNIPAAKYHSGCRLLFGKDGMLYVSTGDAFDRNQAQDKDSLAGKILRVRPDGSIPTDNPFKGSLVWSYGHRNPQGLAWDTDTGELYETEHGPSVIDGPTGGDEVNLITKGANYGWPVVSHLKTKEGMESPLKVYTPSEAPASLMIYSGKMFPQWEDHLFFGGLVGEGILHLTRTADGMDSEKMFSKVYGRIREVREAPDGSIYFSTSNRDGRGNPKTGDDKIYRIIRK